MTFTSVEICAGAGGQALGLEQAGFEHRALVEIDRDAVATLSHNRPEWNVIEADLLDWEPDDDSQRPDLLAGGVPCPPFSLAGKQLGPADERNLFPRALELVAKLRPKTVMLENVRGILGKNFDDYRTAIIDELHSLGYKTDWQLVYSADFGVPQLRPRAILIAVENDLPDFVFPEGNRDTAPTVGETLVKLMASNGWEGAHEWARKAHRIAPTLVGGSKKHGGADLGPSRAKRAWLELGVNAKSLADSPPGPDFNEVPKLTVEMAARIQGFPEEWKIQGRKTSAYRQVGNAFPPPVAREIGTALREVLENGSREFANRAAEKVSC